MDTKSIIDFLANKRKETNENFGTLPSENQVFVEERISQLDSIKLDLESFEAIIFHRNIARCQKEAYKRDRTQVDRLKNKIMIEVDFKQKILIGYGPRQLNSEYYDKRNRQRICLGKLKK